MRAVVAFILGAGITAVVVRLYQGDVQALFNPGTWIGAIVLGAIASFGVWFFTEPRTTAGGEGTGKTHTSVHVTGNKGISNSVGEIHGQQVNIYNAPGGSPQSVHAPASSLKSLLDNLQHQLQDHQASVAGSCLLACRLAQALQLKDEEKWLELEIQGLAGNQTLGELVGVVSDNPQSVIKRIWATRRINATMVIPYQQESGEIGYEEITKDYVVPAPVAVVEANVQSWNRKRIQLSHSVPARTIPGMVEILRMAPDEQVQLGLSQHEYQQIPARIRSQLMDFVSKVHRLVEPS